MYKVYFAAKFDLTGNGSSLSEKLVGDIRSKLLGDSKKLTFARDNITLKNYPILYAGPFYCEQASNGDYTSTDCSTVASEETKAIMESDIFCCIFDLKFSVGSVSELSDAAYAKKRIVVFYRNESNNYTIKSEYWFAICRAKEICKKNGTIFEAFGYDDDVLPTLYNWLTNLTYTMRYVNTRDEVLDDYLKDLEEVNSYTYSEKKVVLYRNSMKNEMVAVERYSNGLVMVKSTSLIKLKGLVDVTSNSWFWDNNIDKLKVNNAIIEGTDGVGKTLTINKLLKHGIVCKDRSSFICKYMLFDVPMQTRIKAYTEYLKEISPSFVIFLVNNSREELEARINRRKNISEFDRQAYEYNLLYCDTYEEMLKLGLENPIELVNCTGLSVREQVENVKDIILRRTKK